MLLELVKNNDNRGKLFGLVLIFGFKVDAIASSNCGTMPKINDRIFMEAGGS